MTAQSHLEDAGHIRAGLGPINFRRTGARSVLVLALDVDILAPRIGRPGLPYEIGFALNGNACCAAHPCGM